MYAELLIHIVMCESQSVQKTILRYSWKKDVKIMIHIHYTKDISIIDIM